MLTSAAPMCLESGMKIQHMLRIGLAVVAILGTMGASAPVAWKGVSSEIPGSVLRSAAGIYPYLRGDQQIRHGSDDGRKHTASEHSGVDMTNSRWALDNWQAGTTTIIQALGLNWKMTYPKLTATLPSEAQTALTAQQAQANAGTTGNISTGGATGIKGLYNALRSGGASVNQAIGMIANAMNESSLNPEAAVMDTNGYMSYGLWQFNAASYPQASALVTGDPSKDMISQIQFLFQVGGLSASSGTTPQQSAGNFASQFERCDGCDPGGYQYEQRVGNVTTVLAELGLSLCQHLILTHQLSRRVSRRPPAGTRNGA